MIMLSRIIGVRSASPHAPGPTAAVSLGKVALAKKRRRSVTPVGGWSVKGTASGCAETVAKEDEQWNSSRKIKRCPVYKGYQNSC
jgi:hypothetical protein